MTHLFECQWFALCHETAELAVEHPVLGWLGVCVRCDNKLDLGGLPAEFIREVS